jgi:hypothetical protein
MSRREVKAAKQIESVDNLKPFIELEPPVISQKLRFLVRGHHWSAFPLAVRIDDRQIRPQRILLGWPVEGGGFRPSPEGEFLLEMTTRDLELGRHVVQVEPLCNPKGASASKALEVLGLLTRKPGPPNESEDSRLRRETKEEGGGGALMRRLDWFRRRFGHIGFIPEGVRVAQVESVRRLRTQCDKAAGPAANVAFIRFQWGSLPRKSQLLLAFAPGPDKRPVINASLEEWKHLGIECVR